jgi:Flp pilus assembly protein TadG
MYLIKMLGKFIRSWVRRQEGTTAIEFSLMAIPYFMLTIGIMEVSIMYASACLLEGATNSAARLIRTGQVQQAEGVDPQEMFRDAICDYASVLLACDKIVIEVRPMDSFTDYDALAAQYDEDGNLVSQGFDAGGSNNRILIRVAYRYEMLTPFIGPLLVGADNSRLFMSTIVLQTEPYDFAGAS